LDAYLKVDEVRNVTFTIRAHKVGTHKLTLKASSSRMIDIVKRDMRVVPDGKLERTVINGDLTDSTVMMHTIKQAPDRIPGSANALIKVEGGLAGVAMDGAENYIHFVSGCGEQATSRLLIDIVAYRNLQISNADPEMLEEYEGIITKGIQYEMRYVQTTSEGKAIVYHPGDKPNLWLTAWGVYAFADLEAAGFNVDPGIKKGLTKHLASTQEPDGSFDFDQTSHWSINDRLLSKDVASTSYVVRSLMYGGYSKDSRIDRAVSYIEKNINLDDSSYTLAMALLALEMAGGNSDLRQSLADKLVERKEEGPSNTYYWEWMPPETSGRQGYWYYDNSIETTAMVLMALAAHGGSSGLVKSAVKYLLLKRGWGVWGSTQSTAVAFQALNLEGKFGAEDMTIQVKIERGSSVGMGPRDKSLVETIHLTEEDRDMLYYIDLRPYLDPSGTTKVELTSTGIGTALYQVIYEENLPWEEYKVHKEMPFALDITYDRTQVSVGEDVTAHVAVLYSGEAPQIQMLMVDLQAPTGLTFSAWFFEGLQRDKAIQQYDFYGNRVNMYIDNVDSGEKIEFDIPMKADRPANSTLQGSRAYDMYNPLIQAYSPPVTMTIS
jgi:uncharacterized protein YfaS (alpha-2-macroglobulin family)